MHQHGVATERVIHDKKLQRENGDSPTFWFERSECYEMLPADDSLTLPLGLSLDTDQTPFPPSGLEYGSRLLTGILLPNNLNNLMNLTAEEIYWSASAFFAAAGYLKRSMILARFHV